MWKRALRGSVELNVIFKDRFWGCGLSKTGSQIEMVRWYSPGKPDHHQRSPSSSDMRNCAPHYSIHFNLIYTVCVTVKAVSRHLTKSPTLTLESNSGRKNTLKKPWPGPAPMEGLGLITGWVKKILRHLSYLVPGCYPEDVELKLRGSVWQEVSDT